MPRGDARTRLVNIPKEFLPLIEGETDRLVFFSQVHTMGVILSQYFNRKQPTWSEFCQEAAIKPDAPIAKTIKKALAKYIAFADEGPEQPPKPKLAKAPRVIEPWERKE
ncbi:hypothetical protein ES705_49684 [subsurface metagenome]